MRKKIIFLIMSLIMLMTGGILASCGKEKDEITTTCKNNKHDYVLSVADSVPATCLGRGKNVYKCSGCGKIKEEETEHLGHSYGAWTTTEQPTCDSDGVRERVCERCGHKDIGYIQSLPHTYELMEEKKANCTEQGYKVYFCTECGDTYTVYDDALGHIPIGEGKVFPATCTEDGYTKYHCHICGEDYKEVIPATGHNFVKTGSTAATCNSFGLNVYKCSNGDCNAEKVAYGSQKLEHHFDENGVCKDCGKHVTEALIFNTRDEQNFSYVEESKEFGYIVHAKAKEISHNLIISRATLNALLSQSITTITFEFGCPDNNYRSFAFKTKGMQRSKMFNNFQKGFGGFAKAEVEFAPYGKIDERLLTSEGLVIGITYINFGNSQVGPGDKPNLEKLTDYALSVGFKKTYNESLPATWVSSELNIEYKNEEWIGTKKGVLDEYIDFMILPETITKWMNNGVKTINITFRNKPDQACAIAAFDNKYQAANRISFDVNLTEEMKEKGYVVDKLYVADRYGVSGYSATEHCNGVIITLEERLAPVYENKNSWMESNVTSDGSLNLKYNGEKDLWNVTAYGTNGQQRDYGKYNFTIKKEIVDSMADKGVKSVRVVIGAKEGEAFFSVMKPDTPVVVHKAITDGVDIDIVRGEAISVTFYFRAMTDGEASGYGYAQAPACTGYTVKIVENN